MLQQSNTLKNYAISGSIDRQVLNGGSLHDESPTTQPKSSTLMGSRWSSFVVTSSQGGFDGIAVRTGHQLHRCETTCPSSVCFSSQCLSILIPQRRKPQP